MKTMLVTGSAGLIGSEAVEHFIRQGWTIHGIDNNMREHFFGPDGSVKFRRDQLLNLRGYYHHNLDIRWGLMVDDLIKDVKPDAVIHCAAQPSHDLAAEKPWENWCINVTATYELLESCRLWCPEAPFVFMSSNKVYGDQVNEYGLTEEAMRYSISLNSYEGCPGLTIGGLEELIPTDGTCRSIYGASKLAADIAVQEYGTYFGMPTVCLRCACLTGPNHAGVALHGFLSYLVKCALTGEPYRINNYKGKQVRDNIHSRDVVDFMDRFIATPRAGEVYNIGGGRGTDVSILEAMALIQEITGSPVNHTFEDHPRKGDFIVWITDTAKAQIDYPGWQVTVGLREMLEEIVKEMRGRLVAA